MSREQQRWPGESTEESRATGHPRALWADAVRALAICSVVLLHAAAPSLYKFGQIPGTAWWAGNVYDSVARIGVPLFLMLSGFLLLGRTESLRAYYVKRLSKIAIPLAAWTLFYTVLVQVHDGAAAGIPRALLGALSKPAFYHLGFLYQLLAIYIALPVLRPFVRESPRPHLWYFVGVWIAVSSILPALQRGLGFAVGINATMFAGLIGYPVLGYALGTAKFPRRVRPIGGLAYVGCVVATALGTYLVTRMTGRLDEYFFEYTSMNIIVMSAAAFLLVRNSLDGIRHVRPGFRGALAALSATSFGIYLMHPAIQNLLEEIWRRSGFDSLRLDPILAIPLTGLAILVLSLGCTAVLQRLPLVKRIVPK